MQRLLIPAILVFSLFVRLGGFAQSPGVVKLCVVGRDTGFGHAVNRQVNSTPEVRTQRDLVVKYVNISAPNSPVKLEAVALTSTNSDSILNEAGKIGCNFIVSLTVNDPELEKSYYGTEPTPERTPGVIDSYIPQPAPIAFTILRPKASNLWVSLPSGSYNPYKWSAKDIAVEVHKTVLKIQVP